jgi:hypothetical protein
MRGLMLLPVVGQARMLESVIDPCWFSQAPDDIPFQEVALIHKLCRRHHSLGYIDFTFDNFGISNP